MVYNNTHKAHDEEEGHREHAGDDGEIAAGRCVHKDRKGEEEQDGYVGAACERHRLQEKTGNYPISRVYDINE